jgi:hypothetical protein
MGKQRIVTRGRSPFVALIKAQSGSRTVTARVRFSDHTHAVTRRIRFTECAAAAAKAPGPSAQPISTSGFTG